MSNTLLDFVMALVRDPEAADRYAADPAGALAAAHLTGVTVTDVQNLIPVVADSLAVATPDFGGAAEAHNVWTSGAAAAAFDAFDLSSSAAVIGHAPPQVSVSSEAQNAELGPATEPAVDTFDIAAPDQSQLDPGAQGWPDDGAWQLVDDLPPTDHHPVDHPGFDLF